MEVGDHHQPLFILFLFFIIEFIQNIVKVLSKELKVIWLKFKSYFGIPITLSGNLDITECKYKMSAAPSSGGARLEEVAVRCQKLLFMITEQESALEFVLMHIYYYIFNSDFWAKGQRVYCSTNQV